MMIILGVGVAFGLLMWWVEERHHAQIESSLISAQVTAINAQTSMMANLTQAMVNALNVNTAIYETKYLPHPLTWS